MSLTGNYSQQQLSNEFSSLSQENKQLKEQLIHITLQQQTLIQQNQKLSELSNHKDQQLIEVKLKSNSLQHSLNQLNKLYQNLQTQHNQIYTLSKCENPLQLRNLYKKQAQLALDLAYIERQSYRETKKTKNEQLNLYQQKIIDLVKQNDNMKHQILTITSQYNSKIYQLNKTISQLQYKLKSISQLQTQFSISKLSSQLNTEIIKSQKPIQESLKYLQIELKLQNTKEKLEFYIKQNSELRKRNLTLVGESKKLIQEIKKTKNQLNNLKKQNKTNKVQDHSSIEYIQLMMEENSRMRRQIEEISQKYVLLAQTYPKLVQDFESIRQLQVNINKLSTIKQLQHQISQYKLRQQSLKQSLTDIQSKYQQQLKSRQSIQYKSSILTKRFNQIFIKMNPYFNIYEYQSLELKQEEYKFFDQNKNYKQLKQYQKEIYQLKRQIKQNKHEYQTLDKNRIQQFQQKDRQITKIKEQLKVSQQQISELTLTNKLIQQKLNSYQLLNIDQSILDEKINQNIINTQVSFPLLQNMIDKLQLQREELLKAIIIKDNKIVQLAQQLRQTTINQKVQYLPITHNASVNQNSLISSQQGQNRENEAYKQINNETYRQISELLKSNQLLQHKYDSSIQQLTTLIHKLQSQLNNQHNIYQSQVKQYQQEYQLKFTQLQKIIQNWSNTTHNLKQLLSQAQNQHEQDQQHKQQKDQQQLNQAQQQSINLNNEMHPQHIISTQPNQQNVLLRHPSHSNLDAFTNILSDQSNNKLIGESTVQNLTVILKKYQQQMSQVLTMCAKLTEQYNQLKQQLKNQQQLQQINTNLQLTSNNLQQQIAQLKSTIQQKNQSLSSIQSLYSNKQSQCQQLKLKLNQQTQLISFNLEEQKKKNSILTKQLAQIKQKLYQSISKPSTEQINQQSVMNKGQFETIVVMHANKNKEISQLIEKNKSLQGKIQTLINQLNTQQTKVIEKKSLEMTPLQQAEFKQLTNLLQQTNLIDLVKKANQIIQKQRENDQKQQQKIQSERQHVQKQAQKGEKMINQEEVEKQKQKSVEY